MSNSDGVSAGKWYIHYTNVPLIEQHKQIDLKILSYAKCIDNILILGKAHNCSDLKQKYWSIYKFEIFYVINQISKQIAFVGYIALMMDIRPISSWEWTY